MRFLNKEGESVVQDNNSNLLSLLTIHFKSFNKVKTRKTTEHDQYNNNVKYGCSSLNEFAKISDIHWNLKRVFNNL